jgi:hypothetical protein
MKVRLLLGLATAAIAVWLLAARMPAAVAASGPPCGERLFTDDHGVKVRVLFAKNGAVQRYAVVNDAQQNAELVHDMLETLQQHYGPEAINAPPLRIVSFKPGAVKGLMVPDKAVDSCGRTQAFSLH